jgi:hypothetical protein
MHSLRSHDERLKVALRYFLSHIAVSWHMAYGIWHMDGILISVPCLHRVIIMHNAQCQNIDYCPYSTPALSRISGKDKSRLRVLCSRP